MGKEDAMVAGGSDSSQMSPASQASMGDTSATPSAGFHGYVALDGTLVAIPPATSPPAESVLDEATLDLLVPAIQSYNGILAKAKRPGEGQGRLQWRHYYGREPLKFNVLSEIRQVAVGGKPAAERNPASWMGDEIVMDHASIRAFLAAPGLSLLHLYRICRLQCGEDPLSVFLGHLAHPALAEMRNRIGAGADLRTLDAMRVQAGDTGDPIQNYLCGDGAESLKDIDVKLLWPMVAERLDLVEEALGQRPQSGEKHMIAGRGLTLLAVLPKVPRQFLPSLMTLATTARRDWRVRARRLLAAADIDHAIGLLLADDRAEVRANAAEWLGQRRASAQAQAPALRQALAQESSDSGRAAILTALQRLGDDLSDFFDPVKMRDEATAGLAKNRAKTLEWFPMSVLPALRWRDGSAVDPILPRWWIVLANKLKQAGGNALVDLWLDRLMPGDAHRLGRFVLTAWIDQDTRSVSQDEANLYALSVVDAELNRMLQVAHRYPGSAANFVVDREVLLTRIRSEKQGEYVGSAVDNRGILALTTHVDGTDMARLGRAYLSRHGKRSPEARALLDALAANGSNAAFQVVLATAETAKSRTVQVHAVALVEAMAERYGWSTEELADRSVPGAGLDETGVAELDCGPERAYQMVLDGADEIVLRNAAGKLVKSLPAPRSDDERPLIEAAKKVVATARKEIRQVMTDQAARLREAMCLERKWSAEDWRSFVLGHPLVARLARRLVWLGLNRDRAPVATFRPLDDGSLSDAQDSPVDPALFVTVQLAHSALLSAETCEMWRRHLADYEVAQPFAQFRRDLPQPEAAQRNSTTLSDRRGWMIETPALRDVAVRLGYSRGEVEDGYFTAYQRRYPDAGVLAMIHFTGSPFPESHRIAALTELTFVRITRKSRQIGNRMRIGDVPPVLLSETWQDLRDMAGKGSGFDPQWEEKAFW